MYIRRTQTNNSSTGERYFTYRLVRGERVGEKVRQITLINLGRHFAILQEDWPALCQRIEELLLPQTSIFTPDYPEHIERAAQRYFGQFIARSPKVEEVSDFQSQSHSQNQSQSQHQSHAQALNQPQSQPQSQSQPLHESLALSNGLATATAAASSSSSSTPTSSTANFYSVDIDSLEQRQPRSVGVEHVALHALKKLGFIDKLSELGINGVLRSAIVGNIVARMAHPASERASWQWLQRHSALGELIDVDFESISHMSLYRASDLLMRHQSAIEKHLFSRIQSLFSLDDTVTLYDLTNSYFEGDATQNSKAKHGRSKEKRSDCLLLTLGLVLDGSGFVRSSKTFAGNVAECKTLQTMLSGLHAKTGSLVVMDAGIATEENLTYLVEHGYRYLVVKRGGTRTFDPAEAVEIKTASGQSLRLQKEMSEDGKEVFLHCHSPAREAKETAMTLRFEQSFEARLQKIVDGLGKPHGQKSHDKLLERIGRLKEKSHGVSAHYTICLQTDENDKQRVTALTWEKSHREGSMATHPGVYCLRSNETSWDEERLWRTYTTLTDLESVFRSLKSELGLRPIFHSKEDRADGHLLITVLAYQCVQLLRKELKAAGSNDSWASLRESLSIQRRITASMRCQDGRTIHVRKSTEAEPALRAIYQSLSISTNPGGTKKHIS